MRKLRTIMGVLSVGLGANLLAGTPEAAAAEKSRLSCTELVMGLCEAYCFGSGYNNCVVHWENRESCQFHVDECF